MGCSFSTLCRSLLPSGIISPERVLAFNGRQFRVLRTLGEGGYAFVYLVQEITYRNDSATNLVRPGAREFALKKVHAFVPFSPRSPNIL